MCLGHWYLVIDGNPLEWKWHGSEVCRVELEIDSDACWMGLMRLLGRI